MICCVSAVSATDINGTDAISDDIVTDEVTDVVEEAEIDDVSEDVVEEEETNPVEDGTINGYTYDYYFNTITGDLQASENLSFTGNFYEKDFGNFKIGRNIEINAQNAIFHNIGFDVTVSDVTINGGTYIFDNPGNITSVINSDQSGTIFKNAVINVTAPENKDFYAIDLENTNNAQILNNDIFYIANYANVANYNYVVKVKGGSEID